MLTFHTRPGSRIPNRTYRRLAGLAVASLLIAGCDSGGSSSAAAPQPTPTPSFDGEEAVEAAAGVVSSTALAMEALLGGFGDEASTARARSAANAPSWALQVAARAAGLTPSSRTAARECDWGGTARADCRSTAAGSVVDARFDGCDIGVQQDLRVRLDGKVQFEFARDLCQLGQIPPAEPYTAHYDGLAVTEINHIDGAELSTHKLDLDLRYIPGALVCGSPEADLTFDGHINIQRGPTTRMNVAARDLTVQRRASGNPCRVGETVSGLLDIDHPTANRRFGATLFGLVASVTADGPDNTSVRLDGEMHADCVGSIDIETVEALHQSNNAACHGAGRVAVEAGDPSAGAIVEYLGLGGVGFDFDGDGSYEHGAEHCSQILACSSKEERS